MYVGKDDVKAERGDLGHILRPPVSAQYSARPAELFFEGVGTNTCYIHWHVPRSPPMYSLVP